MRKQIIYISFVLIVLTAFTSIAWSGYHSSQTILKDKSVCSKPAGNGETIFESLVKQFVGAVKYN
jgi:hypothetical protein